MALLLILLRGLFDLVYFIVVSPVYSYAGFIDNRSIETAVVSIAVFVVSLPFIVNILNDSQDRVSALMVEVLYILSYIPFTTCVFAGMFSEKEYVWLNFLYWMILLIIERYYLRCEIQGKKLSIKFDKFFVNDKLIVVIAVISFFTVMFISWRYTGFRLNFSLMNVYSLRVEAKNFNMPMILNYLLSWTGVVNPLMIGYCILKRNWIGGIIFFCVQVLNFGIAGHKSVLMAPFLVSASVIIFRNMSMLKIKRIIIYAIVTFNMLGLFEYIVFSSYWVIGVFIRRIFFIPNHIAFSYFDFFIKNPFDWFRGSFLRHFGFVSPYSELGISRTIGEVYYNAGNNANNGLFSDAWSNMGYVGIIFMPILLIIVLSFIDKCTRGLNIALCSVISILQAISLMSTSILTVLLTHGMLISCLIFLLLKRDMEKCHL